MRRRVWGTCLAHGSGALTAYDHFLSSADVHQVHYDGDGTLSEQEAANSLASFDRLSQGCPALLC